jgi:hypothetical protein
MNQDHLTAPQSISKHLATHTNCGLENRRLVSSGADVPATVQGTVAAWIATECEILAMVLLALIAKNHSVPRRMICRHPLSGFRALRDLTGAGVARLKYSRERGEPRIIRSKELLEMFR